MGEICAGLADEAGDAEAAAAEADLEGLDGGAGGNRSEGLARASAAYAAAAEAALGAVIRYAGGHHACTKNSSRQPLVTLVTLVTQAQDIAPIVAALPLRCCACH